MAKPTKDEQANRERKEAGWREALRDRGGDIMRENARQEDRALKPDKASAREKSGPAQKA